MDTGGGTDTAIAKSERPADDDLIRVASVPIRDDLFLQYTREDSDVATCTIEDAILARGKLVPQPLAGQDGQILTAIATMHMSLNPEMPMMDDLPVAVEAVSQAVLGFFHGVVLSPFCCGSQAGMGRPPWAGLG